LFSLTSSSWGANRIEAKKYPVAVKSVSKSNWVYLFDDPTGGNPRIGQVIVVREHRENLMAFRVIKQFPGRGFFAAKRIRSNYGVDRLKDLKSYTAIEKTGDINNIDGAAASDEEFSPEEGGAIDDEFADDEFADEEFGEGEDDFADDEGDYKDDGLDSQPPEDDIFLYGGDELQNDVTADDVEVELLEFDEIDPLDPDLQGFTAEFGMVRNKGFDLNSAYYSSFGVRYSLTPFKQIFAKSPSMQDSFSLEGAAFFYQVNAIFNVFDRFNLIPLVGTLRYNLLFGEAISIFFYGGVVFNYVSNYDSVPNDDGTIVGLAELGSFMPAGGIGFTYRLGPKWHLRADLGLDMFASGLSLRF